MKYAVPLFLMLIVISVTAVAALTINANNASNTNAFLPSVTSGVSPRTNPPAVNPAAQGTPQVIPTPPHDFGEVVVPMRPFTLRFHEPTPTRTQETSPVPSTPPFTSRPTRTTAPPTQIPTSSPATTQTTVSSSPTITGTTATPTVSPTTAPVTTAPTTQPVVTVTVYVYPSGSVYLPTYYYPPGYSYPISSYYPGNSLTVTSYPSDAVVLIDGYNSEYTPWVYTNILPGYHTVEIDYPGYEAYITDVDITQGTNPEIDATLVPLQTYGSMVIDSTPEGADVYVDGNYQGTSPVTVAALTEGTHEVELHLAGYEVLTDTENVYNGQGTTVNLQMIPYSSSSQYGSIDVTSDIPGALVYLDGTYKGATTAGTIFNVISVNPGTHTLLLHNPGYTDFVQTVQVNAGQIASVTVVFNQTSPAPAPQEPSPVAVPAAAGTATVGSIVASSSPAGGQVYVDNQFRGVAPVTIYNVAPGPHIINVQLAGYTGWSSSVNVVAGQVAQVTAPLSPGTSTAASLTPISLMPGIACAALAVSAGIVALRRRR